MELEGYKLFMGKEIIKLQDSFFDLPYVKYALKDLASDQLARLNPLIVNCCHGDHVSKFPDEAVLHGSSERTDHELWTIGDRILAMQPHPELPCYFMQFFIINRLYNLKLMTDQQKKEAED